MARKNSKRSIAAELKTQEGKKKLEGSTSKSKHANDPKKVKLNNPPSPPDYAEFLRTYDPQEFYPSGYTSGEDAGSQLTVESKEKTSKPLRVKASK
jgi:hypothetical protein